MNGATASIRSLGCEECFLWAKNDSAVEEARAGAYPEAYPEAYSCALSKRSSHPHVSPGMCGAALRPLTAHLGARS